MTGLELTDRLGAAFRGETQEIADLTDLPELDASQVAARARSEARLALDFLTEAKVHATQLEGLGTVTTGWRTRVDGMAEAITPALEAFIALLDETAPLPVRDVEPF